MKLIGVFFRYFLRVTLYVHRLIASVCVYVIVVSVCLCVRCMQSVVCKDVCV